MHQHTTPTASERRAWRRAATLAVAALLGASTLVCTGSRPEQARVTPVEPPPAPPPVVIEDEPDPAATPVPAIYAEAAVEVAPAPPPLPAADDPTDRPRPIAAELSGPVPDRSREQELQHAAEQRSPVSRELAATHQAVYVIDDLLFGAGSAGLSASVESLLDRLAERLQIGDLDYVVEIRGHTDTDGPAALNRELGERRARAVRDHLVASGGLPAERLVIASFGESLPLTGSAEPVPRARNRRVTVRVLEPKAAAPPRAESQTAAIASAGEPPR